MEAARAVQVVAALRTGILDGTFAPGSPLREVALTQRYGVSRRTVREALLDLRDQGLVVHRHNSGAVVRALDADDIADLYRVRRVLEVEGVRSLPGAPDDRLVAVRSAYDDLAGATAEGPHPVAPAGADAAFHGAVIGLSGSPRIDGFYRGVGTQMTYAITVLQRHDVEAAVPPERVLAEHRAIRDAVLRRDAQEAERLVLEHIATYEQVLLAEVGAPPHAAAGR